MKPSLLIQAFDEPNHTQTPNKLFDIIPEMGEAELRVTLVMVRQTLGYHRGSFRMSVGDLASAAGLSRQGALNGAEQAEARGIFKRSNPDSQKTAEWELILQPINVVDTQPFGGHPSTQLIPNINVVDDSVPLKESIKEKKENIISPSKMQEITTEANHTFDAVLEFEKQAQDAANTGKAWRGRELLPPAYLPYGDWWHAKTGQHMYAAKGKAKVDAGWLKAFGAWNEDDIKLPVLDEAFKIESWRLITSPMQITAKAKAINAAPAAQEQLQREKGKAFYG